MTIYIICTCVYIYTSHIDHRDLDISEKLVLHIPVSRFRSPDPNIHLGANDAFESRIAMSGSSREADCNARVDPGKRVVRRSAISRRGERRGSRK